MAKQQVDIGVEGNDGTGDSIRESFRKVNENFTELYAVFGVEGSLSFLSLGDAPDVYESNKLLTTNAPGNAVIFSSIVSNNGTIAVDIGTPGEINLQIDSVEIVLDTGSPTLGNHLEAANFAIGGVAISDTAAAQLSAQPGRARTYTIDDLVITKGYADRRYITSGLPIRVADEPADTSGFSLIISSYNGDGHLVFTSGHGYDSGANGTAFVFNAEDTDPTGLVSGTTYFIRYESSTELSLFTSQALAQTEDQNEADTNKISVSGTIASDDEHTIVDAGYDANLTGNFLSDVAMPRKSVVRRQGDTMTGNLYLSDHPGDLAGAGTPNGVEDLQAATKYYVDNTAYSSPEVLYVSTIGDDTMAGVPSGKEGTSNTYAYKSINAAAQRANELINTAPEEPGPYFQTLSYGATTLTEGTAAKVTSAAVENAQNIDTRSILQNNRKFLTKEITGYIAFTYPDFAYNVDTCERDLGLIIDAVSFDATRGNTANYLSRTAAERYYSSVSGRIAITAQLERTDDSFAKLSEFSQAVLTNGLFNPKTVTEITKKAGDSPAVVTTSTDHGLVDGNQVIFKNVSGMTEIDDEIIYVRKLTNATFELFTDSALETPYDNSSYTTFVNDGSASIGVRYQSKFDQDTSVAALTPSDNGYVAITQNYALIRNIIRNGIDAGADIVFGNRYKLMTDNSTNGQLDQTDPDNVDALPGKVIVGKRSGAIGRIIVYEQDTSNTTFFLQPLEAKDFDPEEELEMGNFVKAKQVVIRVEAGIYEEDYPIKLTKNVSLKGDEFRRVIIRPKRRVSQSPWADTYFYRDKEFDGITLLTTGTPFLNQVGDIQGFFGRHYLTDNTKPKDIGDSITNVGGYTKAARILELNKEFIQDEIGEYVDATYPLLFSSESRAKCERDIGLIVDALVKDLERGGEEFTIEAQGEYYTGALTPGTEAETADAISQISTIATDLFANTNPSGSGFNRGDVDVDLSQGLAEPTWAAGTSYNQGDFVKTVRGVDTFFYKALVTHTSASSDQDQDVLSATYLELTNTDRWVSVSSATTLTGELVTKLNYAFDSDYNPPKRNDADGVDVFLMDDATIVRNVTVQGHGGFMCVLDPVGQVLTKSPYIQTASSFSRSRNAKAFSGGMFVDAFAGNIPMRIEANSGNYTDSAGTVALNAFTLYVESQDVGGQGQGLKLRLPELPAPFYFEGIRYQVNAISNYDSGLGRAVIYLDPGSGNGLGWNKTGSDDVGDPGHDINDTIQDIFLQTAGNRSILGNDYTQINDLGYGLVTTNGAFSEMVSMFTYYTHAAYYAANGSEIRSLNGSNGYGNFGLVAEGADPNEIPDEVTLLKSTVQPMKAFTFGTTYQNASGDTSVTVYDFKEAPMSNAYFYIDHGGSTGTLNYRISRVENLSDPNSAGIRSIGKGSGAVVNTGIESVDNASVSGTAPSLVSTFENVPQLSTTGSGVGAEFTVVTDGVGGATFTVTATGQGYATTDTVTIAGTNIGGASPANDITIDVDTIFGTGASGKYVDAQIKGTITGATAANPVVITCASHGLSDGDKINIDDVGGMIQLNGSNFFVDNLSSSTFALYKNRSLTDPVNGTDYNAYTSGGTFVSEGGIGNQVFRLSLQEAGSNVDYYGELQGTIAANDFLEYRQGENFVFTGVANTQGITERPSTAVNFDESDLITYRSTGFTSTNDQSQALGSDEIKATFDTTLSFVQLETDTSGLTTTDPDNGAKTLGSQVDDNKIAISQISESDALRILGDSTDATNQTILYPGDVGYTGGMVFAYEGKLHQINDYGAVGEKVITGITQANPAVVTSTGHTLTNGTQIQIRLVEGMTNLNGQTLYVGNVTANTFELFTDSGLLSGLNTTGYNAYTSGGLAVPQGSDWYIGFQDYQSDSADWDINLGAANDGLRAIIPSANERTIWCGVQSGTTAEITVSISLCRATGHDFTQIGTGGFNTSNYPNVLLGAPTEDKAPAYTNEDNASKAQVWERRKGRVFFISSDENGFFRVGKYFVVDQATGSITFAGEVGISRAASLGFKDGVVINEFSNDELFTDLSDTAVPTEKAIANYISRRLGHNGSIQLTGASRFDPGFLALDGSTAMENTLNMNSQLISNLLDPVSDNDAVTKDFLDQAVSAYDELDDLRNVIIHDRTGADIHKQVMVPTGYERITIDPTVGTIIPGDLLEDGSNTGRVIATETRFDKVLNQNVQIITFELLTGTGFNTTLTPVYVTSPGTKAGDVLENPIWEFANAVESSTSDVNIRVERTDTAPYTEINFQLEAQSILNSDVNDDAGIEQNKLMLNRAKPLTSSAGLFGIDAEGGVSATATISGITQASPAVVTTTTDHGLNDSEFAQISDVVGMDALNGNSYYVDVLSTTTFALYTNIGLSTAVDSTLFDAYVSGGQVAGEATGSGRTGQTSRGSAAFEAESFSEDIELTLSGNITAAAGDILYQGDPSGGTKPEGYVNASVAGTDTVVIRTSDTWVDDGSTVVFKSTLTSGVHGTAATLGVNVESGGVKRSGYINLKDGGIGFDKLPRLVGGNLSDDYGGSVIGRATDGTGIAEAVTFATVIDQGKGLSDDDFTTERAYDTGGGSPVVNDPGLALIQYGTAGDGDYAYTDIAYDNTTNSLVKRDNNGKIQATSLILGSTSTQEVLSLSGTELRFKTPELGTILTADGASKPTINTGGVIRVGDIAAYSESVLHQGSDFGSVGGAGTTEETSALAARWMYSSFIEAPDEKGASSTGIGIGAGIGKSLAGSDKITFITGGNVEARVTTAGVETDDLSSMNANTDLTISAKGTGVVKINDTLEVDSISSASSNTDLTLSGKGTGVVYVSDTLKTTAITSGSSSTAGTVTGRWTLTSGSRFEATYADLAEYYEADAEYDEGTVLVFGGEKEVTTSSTKGDRRVAGVISIEPAYVMNQDCEGIVACIALQGRVPVKVLGEVRKGDIIVTSAVAGYGCVDNDPKPGTIIGKALADKEDSAKGMIEVAVGRN